MTAPLRVATETKTRRALPRKLNFTIEAVNALACPPDRREVCIYDTRVAGLVLIVGPRVKTFNVYRRTVAGRPIRYKLGRFPEISIDAARGRAREEIGKIAAGADPQADRQKTRGETTLGELFTTF